MVSLDRLSHGLKRVSQEKDVPLANAFDQILHIKDVFFFLFQVLPYTLVDILGRCVRCRAEIRGKNKGKVKIRRDSKT